MRLIELCDLHSGGERVRHLQITSNGQGYQLGVLAGDRHATHSAHWFALPEGGEIQRRKGPALRGEANHGVWATFPELAFAEFEGDELPFLPGKANTVSVQRRLQAWGLLAFLAEVDLGDPFTGACSAKQSVRGATVGDSCSLLCAESPAALSPSCEVTALALNHEHRLLGVAHGSVVSVWNVIDEEKGLDDSGPHFTLIPQVGTVNSLAFSPDGRTLATVGTDGEVHFWSTEDGHPRKCFIWELGELTAVAFSPDGTFGAVGTQDGLVLLWDLR